MLNKWNSSLLQAKRLFRQKNYSERTEKNYLRWIERFSTFTHSANPERTSTQELKQFLLILANERNLSEASQKQALNAMVFFFRDVLGKDVSAIAETSRMKKEANFPIFLERQEILDLFSSSDGRARLILKLLYGEGLSLYELSTLKVGDFDLQELTLRVISSDKSLVRTLPLPKSLIQELSEYFLFVKRLYKKDFQEGVWEAWLPCGVNPKDVNSNDWGWQWAFPSERMTVSPETNRVRRNHIDGTGIQKVIKRAGVKAGIEKNLSSQLLRNSFAIHVLESGCSVTQLKELMGHKSLNTTMKYVKLFEARNKKIISPLDTLMKETSQ